MAVKFADLIGEADRRNARQKKHRKPFNLELSDGDIVSIPAPDSQTYLALSDVPEGKHLEQLKILFGQNPSAFNRFVDDLEGTDPYVIQLLTESMYSFWGETPEAKPGNSKS